MQKAKNEILQIVVGQDRYLFSLLQKENETGILFNDRIFFLLPDKHIGYVSDAKANEPHSIPFQKPKSTVPIQSIKSVIVSQREFKIKYFLLEDSKKVEKAWVFRAQQTSLAKKWQDKLQFQKTKQSQRKQPPKPSSPQPQSHNQSPTNNYSLIRSNKAIRQRKTEYVEKAIETEPPKSPSYVQVGIDPVAEMPQSQFRELRQTREVGTTYSHKNESRAELHQNVLNRSVSKKDANFGTLPQEFPKQHAKQQQLWKQQNAKQEQLPKKDKVKQEQSPKKEMVKQQQNPKEGKTKVGQNVGGTKKQDFSDLSVQMDRSKANKTSRVEPAVNTIQPSYYSTSQGRRQHHAQPTQQLPHARNSYPDTSRVTQLPKKDQHNQQHTAQYSNDREQPSNNPHLLSNNTNQAFNNSYQHPSIRQQPSKNTQLASNNIDQSFKNMGQSSINREHSSKLEKPNQSKSKLQSSKAEPIKNNDQQLIQNDVRSQSMGQKQPEQRKEERPNIDIRTMSQRLDQPKVINNNHNQEIRPTPRLDQRNQPDYKSYKKEPSNDSSIVYSLHKGKAKVEKSHQWSVQRGSHHNTSGAVEVDAQQEIEDEYEDRVERGQGQESGQSNLVLSNVKYISPEQYEKMNLSQSYYQRTSRLIKQTSVPRAKLGSQDGLIQQKSDLVQKQPNKTTPKDAKGNVSVKSLDYHHPEPKEAKQKDTAVNRIAASSTNRNASRQSWGVGQQIKEEEQQLGDNLTWMPWVFKYVKYNELMFEEFMEFTSGLMQEILHDLAKPSSFQNYSVVYVKDNIRHYQVKDIQIKIALIDLSSKHKGITQKICNIDSTKALRNEFKNFMALYEYLDNSSTLKVPLLCLHQKNGFLGLFKTKARGAEQQLKMREIEAELAQLKLTSKIDHNFFEHHNKCLVKLDQAYYDQFKDPDSQHQQQLSFNCVFIQELEGYLLPDLTADQARPQLTLLRKQLISSFAEQNSIGRQMILSKKSSTKVIEKLSENVLKKISEAIVQINELSVSFFNSQDLSDYLHAKGINLRYMGYIYEYLVVGFQKDLFMTQMAARCCKTLFRKTLQDLMLEEGVTHSDLLPKAYDFLNCILGNTKETSAIWKVVSSHCKAFFGVELSFEEVNPGQFIICLVQNCRLDVIWEKVNPEEAFKSNQFFSERNLIGVKGSHKTFPPLYNHLYKFCSQSVHGKQNQQVAKQLVSCLQIEKHGIPAILRPLEQQLKNYIAPFLSTQRDDQLFKLYLREAKAPSKLSFGMRLLHIKRDLQEDNKENYVAECEDFLRLATKYYGEFHLIFSALYDTFSNHHLIQESHQDAITFAKSSLVNILKICGTAHEKTAESYFKLACCYMKAKKTEQASSSFRKAKKILEQKKKADSFLYAVVMLKMGLLSVNDGKLQDSLKTLKAALSILQKSDIGEAESELVECYESMNRCYQLKQSRNQLRQLSRQVQGKLQLVAAEASLEKLLKIYLYPIFTDLSAEQASSYLDIISQLRPTFSLQAYRLSFERLKNRISSGRFREQLFQYLHKIKLIESYVREANLLKDWHSSKEHQMQSVKDFLSLTEEFLCFLGQGFVQGSLREVL